MTNNPKIIYENDDMVVVNKPAGLLVHPTDKNEKNTLVDWLTAKHPDIKTVGDDVLRPGIVHRLDKDTSGLMVVAKKDVAYNWFKSQFKNRKVVKKYLALVYGYVKDEKGVIIRAIGRSHKDWRKKNVVDILSGKKARTKYEVLKYYTLSDDRKLELVDDIDEIIHGQQKNTEIFTLLDVTIETGRTHQIRVHLKSIGHPLVGDPLYKFKRQKEIAGLTRQFLHSYYLQLQLPNGETKSFEIELPSDLAVLINRKSI